MCLPFMTVIECMLMSTNEEADNDFENIPCMILTLYLLLP